ncbi:MAG: hypothetical protein ORN83_13025, partial [Chthoniobacteraceae bacterium]|nr:hypothetical protein [Chthoniobacteraceae bacterium]
SLYAPQTYTGPTLINGSGLTLLDNAALSITSSISLNYATLTLENGSTSKAGLSDRINDAAPIFMKGGYLIINGRDNTVLSEKLGDLVLDGDKNSISGGNTSAGIRSMDLQFGTLTVRNDATLFVLGSIGSGGSISRLLFTNGESLLQNGILPFASSAASELASYVPGLGAVSLNAAGARGYDASFFPTVSSATQNLRLASGSFTVPSGSYAANAIAFKPNASGQNLVFTNSSDTLNLTSGALLANLSGTNSIGSVAGEGRLAAGGTLTSGTASLYLTVSPGTLNLNSAVVDNGLGAKTRLVYNPYSSPTTWFNAANAHSGGTVFNGGNPGFAGTVYLNAGTGFAIPAGDLIVNELALKLNASNQIAPSVVPKLVAEASLNLQGYSQTLAGLVFDNAGGTTG